MLAVACRFPAGRFHATPWGRHVNEADVEWPPSPWRFLRALIATWHRKHDPGEFPEARLEALVNALSGVAPVYRLPDAVHAHTRHYMPVREGRADKSVLVFDAFLRIDPDEELIIAWPDLDPDLELLGSLDALMRDLNFFGRAESWIECRRLEGWNPEDANCRPGNLAVNPATGETSEPVRLIVPRSAADYAQWQQQTVEDLRLEKLAKQKRLSVLATLPERLIDALRLETGDIQRAGWSLAPGATEVLYQRPQGALGVRRRRVPEWHRTSRITTARFALAGRPLPRVEDTVRVAERMRAALMSRAKRRFGESDIPAQLSGHGLPPDNRHAHAFFLPEGNDKGRIDHVIVHAEAGFPQEMLKVFEDLPILRGQDGSQWQVALESVGGREDERHWQAIQSAIPALGHATVWVTRTPYLHPWHAKKGFGYVEQIRRECRERGLPIPSQVDLLPEIPVGSGRSCRPVQFHRFRTKRGLTQPDTHGTFVRLTFPQPISGPLALGFGCHYGLGLFAPSHDSE